MPRSIDAAWKSVVQVLQLLPAQDPQQQRATIKTIELYVDFLAGKSGVPRATWKQLIREAKVPLKLATVCCSLKVDGRSSSRNSGDASSSGSNRTQELAAAFYAWITLNVFLSAAARDGVFKKGHVLITGRPVPTASNTSLQCAITAQLQQSGLVQQLPSTLLAAAQLLKDATPVADASGHGVTAGLRGGQTAAAAAARPSSNSSCGTDRDTISNTTNILLLLCGELADALNILDSVKPYNELDNVAETLSTAACFCVSVMQHVTAALGSKPAGCVLDEMYHKPIRRAGMALVLVVRAARSSTGSQVEQLLQSPNVMAAFRVVACTWYAYTLLPKASCSSHSNIAAAAAAAASAEAAAQQGCFDWQAAAIFHMPNYLPQNQQQQQHFEPCRQSTGVSMRVAAWVAALIDNAAAGEAAYVILKGAPSMVRQCTNAIQQRQQQQQQLTGDVARLCANQAEDNLLMLQLLLCGLEQQTDLLDESSLATFAAAVAGSTTHTINSLAVCYVAASVLEQEPGGSSAVAAAALPAAATTGGPAAAAEPHTPFSQLLSRWFLYMLPTLLALLQRARRQICDTSPVQAASTVHCSSGSSSSSSAPRRASANSSAQLDTEEALPQMTMLLLVNVLVVVVQHTAAGPLVTSQSLGPARIAMPPACWSEHCARVCAALDSCLRVQVDSSGGLRDPVYASALVEAVDNILRHYGSPLEAAAVLAGSGSVEQQQLFSMFVSMLKLSRALSVVVGDSRRQQAVDSGCIQVALTAIICLAERCGPSPDAPSSVKTTTGGGDCAAETTAAAAAYARPADTAAAAATIKSLPALVLCGRCCLLWADQLLIYQEQTPSLGERLLLLKQVAANNPSDAEELLQVDKVHAVTLLAGPRGLPAGVLRACKLWLSHDDTAEALAAAGYPAERLLQELVVLLDVLEQPAAAPDPAAAVATYDQVVQQLHAVGLAFNTLAFPGACNNPFCSNMSGVTEVESVSGHHKMCAGCRVARYCSKACQEQHWKQHRPACKSLKAAAVCNATHAN